MSIRLRPVISSAIATALISLAASTAWGAPNIPTEEHAVPFIAVSKAALPDPNWERAICTLASVKCSDLDQADAFGPKAHLYRTKGSGPGDYYAIFPGPQLVKLTLAVGKHWTIQEWWDFTGYGAENPGADVERPLPPDIYPALYPLGSQRFAVAVVAGQNEEYMGGGGVWLQADFVELLPDGRHAITPRVSNLPFSCNRSDRACWSDKDYAHGNHCTDDLDGALHLRFVPGSSPGQLDWIATWKETHWPGQEPKSATEHTATSVNLPVGQDPTVGGGALRRKIPFCELLE